MTKDSLIDHTQFCVTEIESDKNKQTKEESQSQETRIQKISIGIVKKKQKTRNKLKWIPIFPKTLNLDSNPIFIYNFFRIMKSYDDSDYQQFYNYGLGILESIELDKINETIDISVTIYSQGLVNFRHLIEMYKPYQNQKYYELALALNEYQKWVDERQAKMYKFIKNKTSNKSILELSETQFIQFQKVAKQWASVYQQDQMILGYVDFQTKIL